MKYFKAFLLFFLLFLVFFVITSSLSYFNLYSNKVNIFFNIVSLAISSFISGFYIGKKSSCKGYLSGIKFGSIIFLFLFSLNYLFFNHNINIYSLVYDFIIVLVTILGSIVGINKKEKAN